MLNQKGGKLWNGLSTVIKTCCRRLKNPKTSPGFKKQAIKQIDPSIELYVKKLRQLPAFLSVGADFADMLQLIKEEEEDLSTPVSQKILKRILSDVTPKREPVTPSVPIKRSASTIRGKTKKPKTTASTSAAGEGTSSATVPWSELPFSEEGPGPDLEVTLQRTLRRFKKTPRKKLTPRDVRQLRPAKGWTSWYPSGKKKKEAREKKTPESALFDSIVKKLSFQ